METISLNKELIRLFLIAKTGFELKFTLMQEIVKCLKNIYNFDQQTTSCNDNVIEVAVTMTKAEIEKCRLLFCKFVGNDDCKFNYRYGQFIVEFNQFDDELIEYNHQFKFGALQQSIKVSRNSLRLFAYLHQNSKYSLSRLFEVMIEINKHISTINKYHNSLDLDLEFKRTLATWQLDALMHNVLKLHPEIKVEIVNTVSELTIYCKVDGKYGGNWFYFANVQPNFKD